MNSDRWSLVWKDDKTLNVRNKQQLRSSNNVEMRLCSFLFLQDKSNTSAVIGTNNITQIWDFYQITALHGAYNAQQWHHCWKAETVLVYKTEALDVKYTVWQVKWDHCVTHTKALQCPLLCHNSIIFKIAEWYGVVLVQPKTSWRAQFCPFMQFCPFVQFSGASLQFTLRWDSCPGEVIRLPALAVCSIPHLLRHWFVSEPCPCVPQRQYW